MSDNTTEAPATGMRAGARKLSIPSGSGMGTDKVAAMLVILSLVMLAMIRMGFRGALGD